MVTIITGATHTGKTLLTSKLVRKTGALCLSLDLLKMGLIRSEHTDLTPYDDDEMTKFMWPIVSEMTKTAIVNGQDLIIEGGYIPADWRKSFTGEERERIKAYCIVMTDEYIKGNINKIGRYADAIEKRSNNDSLVMEELVEENRGYASLCEEGAFCKVAVDDPYDIDSLCEKVLAS